MFRTRLLWALGVMAFLAVTQGLLAVWASRTAESLRVFRSCPLIPPKDARSSLHMLAIA